MCSGLHITHDVPRSTLQDCIKGQVKHGKIQGQLPILTLAEEDA